jgi:hypothetical protein
LDKEYPPFTPKLTDAGSFVVSCALNIAYKANNAMKKMFFFIFILNG